MDLVNHLELKVELYPEPHDLKGQFVKYHCKVPFKVESYEDEIWYDVKDIKHTYILLGRSWKDVFVTARRRSCLSLNGEDRATVAAKAIANDGCRAWVGAIFNAWARSRFKACISYKARAGASGSFKLASYTSRGHQDTIATWVSLSIPDIWAWHDILLVQH